MIFMCDFVGIPALTRYKSAPSTGVLDVTVNTSWLLQKLKKIVKDYQVDSFFLDFGMEDVIDFANIISIFH